MPVKLKEEIEAHLKFDQAVKAIRVDNPICEDKVTLPEGIHLRINNGKNLKMTCKGESAIVFNNCTFQELEIESNCRVIFAGSNTFLKEVTIQDSKVSIEEAQFLQTVTITDCEMRINNTKFLNEVTLSGSLVAKELIFLKKATILSSARYNVNIYDTQFMGEELTISGGEILLNTVTAQSEKIDIDTCLLRTMECEFMPSNEFKLSTVRAVDRESTFNLKKTTLNDVNWTLVNPSVFNVSDEFNATEGNLLFRDTSPMFKKVQLTDTDIALQESEVEFMDEFNANNSSIITQGGSVNFLKAFNAVNSTLAAVDSDVTFQDAVNTVECVLTFNNTDCNISKSCQMEGGKLISEDAQFDCMDTLNASSLIECKLDHVLFSKDTEIGTGLYDIKKLQAVSGVTLKGGFGIIEELIAINVTIEDSILLILSGSCASDFTSERSSLTLTKFETNIVQLTQCIVDTLSKVGDGSNLINSIINKVDEMSDNVQVSGTFINQIGEFKEAANITKSIINNFSGGTIPANTTITKSMLGVVGTIEDGAVLEDSYITDCAFLKGSITKCVVANLEQVDTSAKIDTSFAQIDNIEGSEPAGSGATIENAILNFMDGSAKGIDVKNSLLMNAEVMYGKGKDTVFGKCNFTPFPGDDETKMEMDNCVSLVGNNVTDVEKSIADKVDLLNIKAKELFYPGGEFFIKTWNGCLKAEIKDDNGETDLNVCECLECEGGGESGVCFVEGTEINYSAEITHKVEEVQLKDKVLSFDENTNQIISSEVTSIIKSIESHYFLINNEVKVTGLHRFYVQGDWVPVKDLKVGYLLLNVNKQELPIDSIEFIQEEVVVYNFTINKTRTYFANNLLVHNQKGRFRSREADRRILV
jgi:hypothetical protein